MKLDPKKHMKLMVNCLVQVSDGLARICLAWVFFIGLAYADDLNTNREANNKTESLQIKPMPESQDEFAYEWQDQSVQDVLEQDIRQALRNSRESQPSAQSVQSILAPKLVALYGVGNALMAEVQVGNQAYLYIRGQAYPAGHLGDKRVYQLKGMNGACVQLEKGQDKHSLCLRMLLGENLL